MDGAAGRKGPQQALSADFYKSQHAHTYTRMYKQTDTNRKVGACSHVCCKTPAWLLKGGQKHFLTPKKHCKRRETWAHGKLPLTLQPVSPACCCQNLIKREVSSRNPGSFLQRHNKSVSRPKGLCPRPVQTCQVQRRGRAGGGGRARDGHEWRQPQLPAHSSGIPALPRTPPLPRSLLGRLGLGAPAGPPGHTGQGWVAPWAPGG